MIKKDKELEEFRSLMEVPSKFEDGFTFSSLTGALFVALIMVPGALYMELIAGMGIGGAAQWVTVLLFVEVAKRANQRLSRAQIFVLFYMTGLIVGQNVRYMPLFTQFMVRSEAAVSFGIAPLIPHWVAPSDPAAYETRTFFQLAWLPAIGLIVFRYFFSQIDNAVLGYGLFKVVNDVERLPFPLAPLGAQGILAIAEEGNGTEDKEQPIRFRAFCIGGAIGMVFGLIYMGIPTLSGALIGKALQPFPIPFTDWCQYTEDFLPAVATGLSFDLGQLVIGMVMPFFAMVGSFLGLIATFILNPILYHTGMIHSWAPGQKTIEVLFKTGIDFYISFGIGMSLAIAVVGIYSVVKGRKKIEKTTHTVDPKERGDIPNPWIVFVYFLCVSTYILVSAWLCGWHKGVIGVLLFFGFLYTPIISYVTARLEGMAGQMIEIPFIREITFILSGYTGVAIWFVPVPQSNYGLQTVFYKQAELLGCRFRALWKSNLILFPIILVSMICFSSFIWSLAEIPSQIYPYTMEIWELEALNQCLVYSSTLGEYSPFEDALGFGRIAAGFCTGLGIFAILSFLGAPVLLFYGLVRGIGGTLPHIIIPQFIGALIGRYHFEKKYGKSWRKFIPVLSAGFFVGAGLITMFCIGVVFLVRATSSLPY